MARVCRLFSGSSGNSTFVGNGDGGLLIDAGVSAKRICEALDGIGTDPQSIKGVFISHEHIDHIAGVRVFCSKFGIPLFATKGTLEVMERDGHINGKFDTFCLDEGDMELDGFKIEHFPISHDCAEGCGYKIELPDGRTAAVCTDLGFVSEQVKNALCSTDLIFFESNHDIDMLKTGCYPYPLKQRIMSHIGHLSNDACAEALPMFVKSGTTRIILSHLSEHNNMPILAKRTALFFLKSEGMKEGEDFLLSAAPKTGGEVICY